MRAELLKMSIFAPKNFAVYGQKIAPKFRTTLILDRYHQAGNEDYTYIRRKIPYSMEQENLLTRITINANICHGKPTIRGLRYPVENMLELLAAGMSYEEILADYPDLVKEDLLACLAYAVRVTQTKAVYPLAS